MRFKDYMRLAIRNIQRQRQRNLLAVLAVVIGAASVTIMLALIMGARDFYIDQFQATGKLQQVVVNRQTGLDFEQSQRASSCDSCIKLTDKLADRIKSQPHVTGLSRTADVYIFEAVALAGQKQVAGNVQSYEPNGVIKHMMLAGQRFNADDGAGKVIIGQSFADKWGYKGNYEDLVGKQVEFTTVRSYSGEGADLPDPQQQFQECQDGCRAEDFSAQYKPSTLTATVVGIQSDEASSIFLPLQWAEQLLETRRYEISEQDQAAYTQAFTAWSTGGQVGPEPLPEFTLVSDSQLEANGYSTFVIKTDSADNAEAVAEQIRQLGVGAATAKSYVDEQLRVFNIISLILGGIGSISLIVAAIGIINTMVMAILERTREIGVMRAVGARRSVVSRLFTLEASLLGFLGGGFGIVLGFGLIQLANVFINIQLAENGIASRNIVGLSPWLILSVMVATGLIGMLAGIYPAHRAASLDPVEALRRD